MIPDIWENNPNVPNHQSIHGEHDNSPADFGIPYFQTKPYDLLQKGPQNCKLGQCELEFGAETRAPPPTPWRRSSVRVWFEES